MTTTQSAPQAGSQLSPSGPRTGRPAPHERTTSFEGLQITYDADVLRPRPWTVAQSRWAADLLRSAPPGPVLELCAGAGQIGLLAVAIEPRALVAVDASAGACAYLRRNAFAAGLDHLVEVRHGQLADAVAPEERYALVIADPPWVPTADTGQFAEDPLHAIDGGDDGLDCARECLEVAVRHLEPGGHVVLQLGCIEQMERLRATASTDALPLVLLEVRQCSGGVLGDFLRV